jgi:hypothetical protein
VTHALGCDQPPGMWHTTHRKPKLLLRLSGWFLLRMAARQLLAGLFQEPPRTVAGVPCGCWAATIVCNVHKGCVRKMRHRD